MGADFVEKATATFEKSWDNARTELATSNLFTKSPSSTVRTAAADILDATDLAPGMSLVVENSQGQLVGRLGTKTVAIVRNPPVELIKAIDESCGVAKGTIEEVHKLSHVVEISLC